MKKYIKRNIFSINTNFFKKLNSENIDFKGFFKRYEKK